MAYKFQLGAAKLSGSITQTDGALDARATTVDSLDVSNGGISAAGAIGGVTTISGSGKFQMGSFAVDGTDVTATAAELNLVDGADATNNVASKAAILDSSKNLLIVGNSAVQFGDSNNQIGYSSAADALVLYATGATGEGAGIAMQFADRIDSFQNMRMSGSTQLQFTDNQQRIEGASGELSLYAGDEQMLVLDFNSNKISGSQPFESTKFLANDFDVLAAGDVTLFDTVGANILTLGASTSTVKIAGDLEVAGTINRVTETELLIEDKTIIVASGSANVAAAAGAGLVIDVATGDKSFLFQENGTGGAAGSGDIFVASSSAGLIDIQAAAFYGSGANLTGVVASTASTLKMNNGGSVVNSDVTISNNLTLVDSAAARTLTLPSAAGKEGTLYVIKDKTGQAGTNNITIQGDSGQLIDGASSIKLESNYAAVSLIAIDVGGTPAWMII